MSSNHSSPSGAAASNAAALISSCPGPHPDSFVPGLLRKLRNAVNEFKTQNGSSRSCTAVAEAFKSAGAALDRAAPASGQHKFHIGERVVLQDLRQRADLNGCAAVVKTEADATEGAGRVTVEVSVENGRQGRIMSIKPKNMRLEWHVAADAHAASVGCKVLVRSLVSKARSCVCQVVDFDAQDRTVAVHATASKSGPAADVNDRVSVHDLVPASYIQLAKEVHVYAMEVFRQAVDINPKTAAAELAVLQSVHSCSSFNIRCDRANEATQAFVTVLNTLHTGGQSALFSPQNFATRQNHTVWFVVKCGFEITEELQSQECFEAACSNMTQCKSVIETIDEHYFNDDFHKEIVIMIILEKLSVLHETLDRLDDAEAIRMKLLSDIEMKHGQTSSGVADMCHRIGELHMKQGRMTDAEKRFKQALGIYEVNSMNESLEAAATLVQLAAVHEKQDRLDEVETMHKKALRIFETAGLESEELAHTRHNLGFLYHKQGRLADAEAMYKQALLIREQKAGPNSWEVALTLNNLSMMYSDSCRLHDAVAMGKRALRIGEQTFGPKSLEFAHVLHTLAILCMRLDRLADAEAMFKEVMCIRELKLGSESLDVAHTLNNFAGVQLKQNRLDHAGAMFNRALRIKELNLGHETLGVANTIMNLANVHMNQNRLAYVETMLMKALRIFELNLGHEALGITQPFSFLASLYSKQGRMADAEAMYNNALCIFELWNHESLDFAQMLYKLANLHTKQDRLANSEARCKSAVSMIEKIHTNSNDRMEWSLVLVGIYEKTHKVAEASEVMHQCCQIQRRYLSESPDSPMYSPLSLSSYRIHLFDSRLFVETSFLSCKYKLMHDASSFPCAVRQLIGDSQVLLQSHVALQGTSPYSVTTAARYLLVKAVEFAQGSDHSEALRFGAEAHERLARLMTEQLVPPSLRSAGRHAVAAVQWTQACDADDLQRRKQLVDDIDAAYADSHWMMDDDVRYQVDAAVETFHDDVVLQMFAQHSVESSSLQVSPSVQNLVTQLFVQLNCILDQAWSRVVQPLCCGGDAVVYFRGDYRSTLAVQEELLAKTGTARLPVFQVSHLQELLSANGAQLYPAFLDVQRESRRMFRLCGLPELEHYFSVSDVAPANLLKFKYESKHGNAAQKQQLKSTLEATASRLHHEELYAGVLSKWLNQCDAAQPFDVSPLEDKTWITVFVGALQELGWVSRLKENRVVVHGGQLPVDCSDVKCQPLLRFVSEGFVGVLLNWLRKVGDSSFVPLMKEQVSAFKSVIVKLNETKAPPLPDSELLQETCGCWFLHRQRAVELKCVFDDDVFHSNVEEAEKKVETMRITKDRAQKKFQEYHTDSETAKTAVDACFAEFRRIENSGGDAFQLASAKSTMDAAKAAKKSACELVSKAKKDVEDSERAYNQATAKGKELDVARKQLKDAKSLHALILPTIEDKRPKSWAALQHSMDCRRYRDINGQACGPDEWSKTWTAPLVWISVDNKHVRLTPTLQSSNLKLSTHGFSFADARLTIDYVARRSFYPWTFVRVLSAEGAADAVELSEAVLWALRRERHVVQGRVVHADAIAYKIAVGKNSSHSEQRHCKQLYESALKALVNCTPNLSELSSSPKMLAAVVDVMLKKVLQESHLRLDPDFCEDALLLLQNCFVGMQPLLQEFGREAHQDAGKQMSLTQRLRTELTTCRHSKILNPIFSAPNIRSEVGVVPAVVSADDCLSVRAVFEWMSQRGRFAEAEQILAVVLHVAKDIAQPFWLRKHMFQFLIDNMQHAVPQAQIIIDIDAWKQSLSERENLLSVGDIDEDISSQLVHSDAELQRLELDNVLYAGYSDSPATQCGMLQDIESRVVQVCLKLRAVAEQSLMRALEPTVLRPRDDTTAAADGSWDIKFKGGADKVAYCEWLVESKVSLDFVRSCDGIWFTSNSVDGLSPGDAVFFVGESLGSVSVTDPYADTPTLYYIHAVGNSKFCLCNSPGTDCLTFNADTSSVMFVCRQSSLPLPPCIQRYPALFNAVEQLFPHQVFASHRQHQHDHEWLHLIFLISNYAKHDELRNVVLPAAHAGLAHCPGTALDDLYLCSVPYSIEGFAFTDAARRMLDSAADNAAAVQLSIAAVKEMKRLQVLSSGGRPTGAVLPTDVFTSLIPDGSKRVSFVAEVERVVAAVQVRMLPRHERLLQPPCAMAAIRRPLMPTLRAAWQGALALARVCADVKRSHFKLADGSAFQYQASPLQLQFVMSPNVASAAAKEGYFQLLLLKDSAMVPCTDHHALPFLTGLQQHITVRLPNYADVTHYIDKDYMSLYVQCSLSGLLQDLFNCVLDSARSAMPESL